MPLLAALLATQHWHGPTNLCAWSGVSAFTRCSLSSTSSNHFFPLHSTLRPYALAVFFRLPPQASLSFSEVKDKAVTPFSAVAKLMPEQFVTESTDSLKELDGDTDGENKVHSGSAEPREKKFAKWSFRWFVSGMLHPSADVRKLFTYEDSQFIHKTLGISSLISFIYRYGYVYNTTGTLGFDGKYMDWVTMALHTLLAFSSIIFRVPAKRIDNKPMVIYEEYRQHAMVFTHRCMAVYVCAVMFPDSPRWFVPSVVCAHHYLADRITDRHGSGSTAVRANPNINKEDSSGKVPDFFKRIGYLYSFYQFLAVASHILPMSRLADMAYNAIIAIQSSAFMMTLYRKRIVRGRTHVLVYSGCLVLSGFHIVRMLPLTNLLLVMGAFALRVNLPRGWSNKYLIWTAFLMAASWWGVLQQNALVALQGSAPAVYDALMMGSSAVQAIRGISLF